ncbi:MAG: biotin/lipoyl-containing protein [Pseudomonadota bacterium]
MKIDASAIRQLAKLLEETGLNEIEVASGDEKVRVNKGSASVVTTQAAPVAAPAAVAPVAVTGTTPGAVTSPMVGTVYLQAEPGNPPFIQKGTTVKAGDTLVIIEAMKVMNPIKAPKSGTVTQVLVDNGQPVEFGEALVVVE